MKKVFVLLLMAACGGAEPDGWIKVEAGNAFSFYAPPNIEQVPVQGEDSFVGMYRVGEMELLFDYGRYSDPLNGPENHIENHMISGRQARVATQGTWAGVHFPSDAQNKMLLTMSGDGKTREGQTVLLQVYETIVFTK